MKGDKFKFQIKFHDNSCNSSIPRIGKVYPISTKDGEKLILEYFKVDKYEEVKITNDGKSIELWVIATQI